MERENGLWDDYALVTAFENAMTKYKTMHGKEYHNNSTEGEKVMGDNVENVPALSNEIHDTIRHTKAVDHSKVVFDNSVDAEEANDLPPSQENHANSYVPEPCTQNSNVPHMQEALEGYTNSQGALEYTQLLNQYNELEEQKQKVLQQLHQAAFWNYQYSGESSNPCVQWDTRSAQGQQNLEHQASHPTMVSTCCPYVCPCLVDPCPLMPTCVFGGTCKEKTDSSVTACTMSPKVLSCLENDSIVKTAMGAAERAISSTLMKTCSTSDVHEEEEKEKKESLGLSKGEMAQCISSETDLAVVLNAWYSAGFYTGKYLLEQSIAKGRRG